MYYPILTEQDEKRLKKCKRKLSGDIFTLKEFNEMLFDGSINSDDGLGYFINKDGKEVPGHIFNMEQYKQEELNSFIGVSWYNK